MMEFIENLLVKCGISQNLALRFSTIIAAATVIIVSLVLDVIVKKFLLRFLKYYIDRTKTKWDNILMEKKFFQRVAHIVPVGVIHLAAPLFPAYQDFIQKIAFCFIIAIVILVLKSFLDAVNEIYSTYEVSKVRPIRGYLQVIEIIIYVIGTIVIISVLIDRSPWLLLSGIGAATAVLMLIFQNSILGLVAGFQIASNNMLRIGDWIEMPKYEADGYVVEMTLHTIKVQNFDKTITNIPTHAFISQSFRNWRGMQEAGGRRIKRAIYIDMTSIKFCTEEMLKRFEEIHHITEYIRNKREEIAKYNKENNVNEANIVNGRRLTNVGVFRIYIENYLKNHPKISNNLIQIVRHLAPGENGLPIEIYAFVNRTAWVEYEGVQADIFDHILAVVPQFDLRIYQSPTGYDFGNLIN